MLVDHAPQAMAVADLDNDRLLDVNAALCREVERSKSRLLGGSLSQLGIHDCRDKPDFKERLRSHGWLQGRLLQHCPRSGPAKDISVDAKTIRSSSNQRLAVLCFQPASSDPDQAEDALQESRERFELAMKACRDGLWDWDIESGHVYYSPAYSAMLGFSEKELRGKIDFWKRRLHSEDKEHTLKANQDCIENRRDRFEVEFRMQTRHGHWRWILGRGQAVARDAQGRAIRMIGTHTDITERKRAEEALRASEKRFRDLSSLLPQSVWEVDLQGRITYINEAALSIFGYTWAELGNDLSVFDVLAAEDRQRAEATFRRLLSRTQPDHADAYSEYTCLRKDGTRFPVIVYSAPILLDGCPVGVRGIALDVSRQKRIEHEHRKLQEQLFHTQKLESVGRLAGGIAHEFNNLLQGMLGNVQLLQYKKSDHDSENRYLKQISANIFKSKTIIDALLTFSRETKPRFQDLDLKRLIHETIDVLSPTIPKTITIQTELAPGPLTIQADPQKLSQVLINILNNACDAIAPGRPGTVRITAARADLADRSSAVPDHAPHLTLVVSDTGVGMPPQTQKRVFEPFFTTKEPGEGSGLGLSTVYSLVRLHSGEVHLSSQPDRGTSLSIVLPERQPGADGTATDALDQTENKGGPAQPATILVVEDEQTIRQITREHLEQQGFRVIEAENGQAAFRLFRKQSAEIDLILLDLAMPGMNGEEVIEKIKALQAKPKIIVLSGYSRHDMASEPERYGIHEFLRKPLRLESLISSINSALKSD